MWSCNFVNIGRFLAKPAPIDRHHQGFSIYKAIDKQVDLKVVLNEWRIEAVTEGIDAIGDAIVKLEYEGSLVIGRGSDTDILVASAKAYIDGLNKLSNK